MAHYGEAYQNLCNVQKALIQLVTAGGDDLKGLASCAKEIRELEAFKRELRGLPRLKAADLIANMKRLPRASAPAEAAPVEITATIEPDKESLKNSFSQTVTAPPTGDAPISGRGER